MKNFPKRALSLSLAAMLALGTPLGVKAGIFSTVVGSVLVSTVPRILSNMWYLIENIYSSIDNYIEIHKYSSFNNSENIIDNLKNIVENKSKIKVYGQEKAKKQIFDVLSGVVTRIDNLKKGNTDIKEVRGNIVYLIGPSGTGKTKMCYAIADAFLRHPEKTAIFCHSESVTSEAELGVQLFKTITTKDIGKKRQKNIFTGNDGLIPKDEESPLLKHLLNWYESVVIIDEYDKMKQKSAKPGSTMNINGMILPTGQVGSGEDKSADEILRSIASTGKYKFMNKEVDCSKVLFLVTTNETREELENKFGIGGIQGGGVQRLNIIEFDFLTKEACYGIVNDTIKEITKILTDKNGLFKLKDVKFDLKSTDSMVQYIFDEKNMQGRAKYKLEDSIYSFFSKNLKECINKEVSLKFIYSKENKDFYFTESIV